jgi:type II secretory pathway component PulF
MNKSSRGMGILGGIKLSIAQFLFTTSIRLSVFEKLASFMASGIPIVDVLKILDREYSSLKDVLDVRPFVMRCWIKSMDEKGMTFSQSLEGWVPASERMLISSGEDSGDIEDAFKNCIETTTATKKMVGTIVGKLTYPVILVVLLFVIIALFSLKIVPILTSIAPPSQWPAASQDLYTLSQFTTNYWYWVLLGITSTAIIITKSLGSLTGPIRTVLNKVPPYSMYRSFQSSVLIMSLSSMMRSGVPIEDSLKSIAEASNIYIRKEINKVLKRMGSGMEEGDAFKTDFFDSETKVDIAVYAETDNIAVHMDAVGRTAIENGVKKVSAVADLVKILTFFAIAVYLCWAYYSFFMVVQNVGQAASKF